MRRKLVFALMATCMALGTYAQEKALNRKEIVKRKDLEWFGTEEAKTIAENVLLYQRDVGGWPKNIQMQNPLTDAQKDTLRMLKTAPSGCTTDNGATILEMTYLSKMYGKVADERYKSAFLKGLDYLLEAQYDNGGWPQFYPLKKGYYTHVTYNDNSMVNIMTLLRELLDKPGEVSIVPNEATMARVKTAFDKGIDCILKSQYAQNGTLTAWCAQHDEKTLQPAKARAYELPSLSGKESAGIVLLLMSVDNPSPEIKKAIHSAIAWFEKTKITGSRVEFYTTEAGIKEKRLVPDSTAAPMWARFMELEDNKPFFCDRDGIKKSSMFDIGIERRVGYEWYSNDAQKAILQYPKWKKKWGEQ